jgi:hypothetical protein
LLFWLGSDRILYGSDYGIWSPKWIVEALMNYELPADVAAETDQALTLDVRRKIMGENAARLYGIKIPEQGEQRPPWKGRPSIRPISGITCEESPAFVATPNSMPSSAADYSRPGTGEKLSVPVLSRR